MWTAPARAKINLHLAVHARRADGYHALTTVFQTIDLADTLTIVEHDGPFTLRCPGSDAPEDDSNLVSRAARALASELGRPEPAGLLVTLHKQVPTQAEGTRVTVTKEVTKTVTDVASVRLSQSRIQADLQLTNRQKGLLWYDTYGVRFSAHYTARNPDPVERVIGVELKFPSSDAIYDQFVFRVNGESAPPASDLTRGLVTRVRIPAGSAVSIDVAYVSRGMDDWEYAFVDTGVAEISDFELALRTDFVGVDYPAGSMSPTLKQPAPNGWQLTWQFKDLVTGGYISIEHKHITINRDLPGRR